MRTKIIIAALIIAGIVASILAYPHVPERMASHWNLEGRADGYSSKVFVLSLTPLLSLLLFALLALLPRIDPFKDNYKHFKEEFEEFMIALALFFLIMHVGIILANTGVLTSIMPVMSIGIAFLFFTLSRLLGRTKRNWFFGIRTPWTLSSDAVWEKTNALAARMFKALAVIALLPFFLPQGLIAFLACTLATAVALVVFSYVEYKKLGKKAGNKKS